MDHRHSLPATLEYILKKIDPFCVIYNRNITQDGSHRTDFRMYTRVVGGKCLCMDHTICTYVATCSVL